MTLVIGSHFGNVTGIMADTRGTRTLPTGQRVYWDDCVKIHNALPSLTVGIAGSAGPAVRLLQSFSASMSDAMSGVTASDVSAHLIDVSWMCDMMRDTYSAALNSRLLQERDKFGYIFSTQDVASLRHIRSMPPSLRLLSALGPRQASFGALTKLLSQEDGTSHLRKVFSMEFPIEGGRIMEAAPGDVLLMGSGAHVERPLGKSQAFFAVFPGSTHITIGDRVGAVGHSIGLSQRLQHDATFNGIMLGVAVSAPWFDVTISGFPQWPQDGLPEKEFQWQPLDPTESIPPSYSAGFDTREENVAWIYSRDTGLRLRLRSMFDLLADVGAEELEF